MTSLVMAFANVLQEHDWRWAIRDSKSGEGVRIACSGYDCEWAFERVDMEDDVWAEHRLHVAEVLARIAESRNA